MVGFVILICVMSELDPLLDILKGMGASAPVVAVLAFVWWSERGERKAQGEKLWTLMQSSVAAEQAMAHSLDVLSAKIK
jgi:hypothetical protein